MTRYLITTIFIIVYRCFVMPSLFMPHMSLTLYGTVVWQKLKTAEGILLHSQMELCLPTGVVYNFTQSLNSDIKYLELIT